MKLAAAILLAFATLASAEPRPIPRPAMTCAEMIARGDVFINQIMREVGLPDYPADDFPDEDQFFAFEDALSDNDPRAVLAYDLERAACARGCVFPGEVE